MQVGVNQPLPGEEAAPSGQDRFIVLDFQSLEDGKFQLELGHRIIECCPLRGMDGEAQLVWLGNQSQTLRYICSKDRWIEAAHALADRFGDANGKLHHVSFESGFEFAAARIKFARGFVQRSDGLGKLILRLPQCLIVARFLSVSGAFGVTIAITGGQPLGVGAAMQLLAGFLRRGDDLAQALLRACSRIACACCSISASENGVGAAAGG